MDMEWNQTLTFSEMVKDPVFLTGEIIQIGAINTRFDCEEKPC